MKRNYLFDARKLSGKTQNEIADFLKMNQSTYSTKESKLDFTVMEWQKIERVIGRDSLEYAKQMHSIAQEPSTSYGKSGDDHRRLLSMVNKIMALQESGVAVLSEFLAELKGLPVETVINKIKEKYKEKTGESIDI